MQTRELTLLIISHKKHIVNPDNLNEVYVKGGFFAIKNEFAKHFKKILLCVPVKYEKILTNQQIYSENIKILPLPWFENRIELLKKSKMIIANMKKGIHDCDIVYAMGPNDIGVMGMALAKLKKKKFFISLDTDRAEIIKTRNYGVIKYNTKYFMNKKLLYPYIRKVAWNVPAFVTGDMFMGKAPAWHQWVKSTYTSESIGEYRKMAPWKINKPIRIVFAGRFSPEKNIEMLMKASSKLWNEGFLIELFIIGEGALEKKLREECVNNKWQFVRFMGYISNKELIKMNFCDADIFVLPSKEERQGKVLLEAMACSIPVIASNAGGIPAVIKHGYNGLLFNPNDFCNLCETIKSIINNEKLRSILIENGYRFAKKHTLDLEIQKIVNIVENYGKS